MKEFEIEFTIAIGDRKRIIYTSQKGVSLEQVAEMVQSDLIGAGWIANGRGRYYRTSDITDFLIREIPSEEQNQ